MDEVKRVVKAGTTRKIIVKTESGEEIAQFMLPVGLGLLIVLPVLSGLAVTVAMISKCTIVLEKEEETGA